jgi:hypothetical protein
MMRTSNLTAHAQARAQNRGISERQIQLLEIFGEVRLQKGKEWICTIPDKELATLRRAIDGLRDVALVQSSAGQIITAMHKDRKIRATDYVA